MFNSPWRSPKPTTLSFFMPSGGLQGTLHFRHLGGILYLDFFAAVCYTPNRTVTVFPQRQLQPIQGKPVVGSFLFPGLTFAPFGV